MTIQRLAQEQAGITLDDLELIAYASADNNVQKFQFQEKSVHPHSFLFSSTTWQGEVNVADEYLAFEFFSLSKLPVIHQPMAHYIDVFLKWLPERQFLFV
jgi:hypothetical protein